MAAYQGIIDKYKKYLPVEPTDKIITLCEGNTPLIELVNITSTLKKSIKLYAKFEGLNPTGSFKDRGMVFAVSKAVSANAKAIICASTGNTSASAAAYAARAGIKCFVILPDGKIAMGKLAQALIAGAVVIKIRGNFDEGLRFVRQIAENESALTVVNSINPYRIQGQKTISYEIVECLGRAPDYHYLPVGNAGNITAHWQGYQECVELKKSPSTPKMIGYQAQGAAPFVFGTPVKKPETLATAIRIGDPQSYKQAVKAKNESSGWFATQSDEQILAAQKLLAQHEGVFCEPASAVSVAGVIKDVNEGKISEGSTVVCTLTGNGLKDPDIAIMQGKDSNVITVESSYDEVAKAITAYLR